MPAEQLWRRQIHQAALVLIDQPPALDADMPLLSRRMQRRAHALRLRLDHRHRLRRLLGANHRRAALDDGGLLAGDRGQRVAEEFRVVHADRRDDGRDRPVDHIGGVEPSAEAGFQQHDIGLDARANRQNAAAVSISKIVIGSPALTCSQCSSTRAQLGIVSQPAAALLADAEAFVDPHQIGRGVDVDAQARGLEDRAQIGDGRTLAVGAGDMDHRRQHALPDDRAAPAGGACDRG